MNKLFITALAVATLASCSQSETIYENASTKKAIAFDNAYIGKTTRAVPVSGNAFGENTSIGVFSTSTDGATNLMTNQEVRFSAGGWTYTPQQFYEKDKTYKFDAYFPYKTGVSSIADLYSDYEVDADITKQVDLMYTNGTEVERMWTDDLDPDMVQFSFKHALAQVKFSARTVADYSSAYTLKITGLTLKNVLSKASLTRNTDTWSTPTTPVNYTITTDQLLGQDMELITTADQDVFMLIPQTWDTDLEVEITINVEDAPDHTADIAVSKGEHKIKATIPASPDKGWERNHIYNYQLNLNLDNILNMKSIIFENPIVEDWAAEEKTLQTVVVTTPAP